ncbi:MAG: AIR synthase-related protein, partial [Thermaerobacterales bacterium]
LPVTGGNVSLYNETEGQEIWPTPVVGVIGVMPDARRHAAASFQTPGDLIFMLGEPDDALGGSLYLQRLHGLHAGPLPELDLSREGRLIEVLVSGVAAGLIISAHDVSDGGLAVTLAESCFGAPPAAAGASVTLPETWITGRRMDGLLFGEGPGRVVISVRPADRAKVAELAAAHDLSLWELGTVAGGQLEIQAGGETLLTDTEKLAGVWREAISCLMD